MPFGAHETMEVHEILNEKVNALNHMAFYAKEARDSRLKQMIQDHMRSTQELYNRLVGYTHDYTEEHPAPVQSGMPEARPSQIVYGLKDPSPAVPQGSGRLQDGQILSALLLCHKNGAKNAMASSLECADPNVRTLLGNMAVSCANQAYEVFLMMNEQGSYQVPTMNDHTAKTFLHSYQPTTEESCYQESPVHQSLLAEQQGEARSSQPAYWMLGGPSYNQQMNPNHTDSTDPGISGAEPHPIRH